MKKLIITAALGAALIGTPAMAELHDDDACANLGILADAIAEARYAGVPIGDMMEVVRRADTDAERVVYRAIVMDAYSLPDYRSHELRDIERQEYANSIALACYQAGLD